MSKPDYIRHDGVALFADDHQMKRVQSFSSDSSYTTEDILELANKGVAEQIDDLDTVSASLSCHEFGSTDNFAKVVNYFQDGDNNNHYMTDDLFDNAQVDFIIKTSTGGASDSLNASCWYGSQWLTGATLTYSSDGYAEEAFTFEGEYKRWFLNSYKDTRVVSGTYTSATVATAYGVNLQTGYTPLILTVNGVIASDVNDTGTITLTDSGANTTITATSDGSTNVTFASGDRIRLVYAKNTADAFDELSSTPDGIGALRRGMIDIYLFNSSGTEEKTLRLSNVSLNITLDRTGEPELGEKKFYARTLTRPITVEGSIDAKLSDLEVFAKMANQESAFDADTLTQISWDSFSNDNVLVIKLYKSESTHTAANLLKTVHVTGLGITANSDSYTAGENSTVSFTIKADNCIISGSSVSPFL